jgi:aryl carrier-like protein
MAEALAQARGFVRLLERAGPASAYASLSDEEACVGTAGGQLETVLQTILEVTDVQVQATDKLRDLGLDSIGTGQLVHELRHVLRLTPADLSGDATIAELVEAGVDSKTAPASSAPVSFAAIEVFRAPLVVLVMLFHCPGDRDSLWGGAFAIDFFMNASFAFWYMTYPRGEPLYGRKVRSWVYDRLLTTLPMYYVLLVVQEFYFARHILDRPYLVRAELLNWAAAGVLVGYWDYGNTVTWFLATQAWLILAFPLVEYVVRVPTETTGSKLGLLVALAVFATPLLSALGLNAAFSMNHPAFMVPMMAVCITVTADLSSESPLLASVRLRQVVLLVFFLWFVLEAVWWSAQTGYTVNDYIQPIAAVAIPFLLQPTLVWSGFESFLASPVGRGLSAVAPYSMGMYVWQGIFAKLVLPLIPETPPCPQHGCNIFTPAGAPMVEMVMWKQTLFKVIILGAIAYASNHLIEKPLSRTLLTLKGAIEARSASARGGVREMV